MKNSKILEIVGLGIIIAIAVFFCFYKLAEIPNGIYVDEAVTGYNAYSILQTGKDEYSKSYPLAFRYFGSYSPPLYVYLTTLPVKYFGLNAFSTRFISALSGVISVIIVYFFLKSLLHPRGEIASHPSGGFVNNGLPLIAGFLLAICPWSIFFSRAGYEIYLGFLFYSVSVFLLWKALSNSKWLIPAFLVLSLSTYTSHTLKFLAPILLAGYIAVFQKTVLRKDNIKPILIGSILLLITQIPNIYLFFTPSFNSKLSLFNSSQVIAQAQKIEHFLPGYISYPLALSRELLAQYINYFSPRSLFFLPDPDLQRSAPELPVFYNWLVIPYLTGLYILWKNRKELYSRFLIFLMIITPLPVIITGDPFSSQRAIPLLLPLISVITLGFVPVIQNAKPRILLGVITLVIAVSLISLWRSYFILLPKERAKVWGYGFKELTTQIKNNPGEKFIIDQSRLKPAYIEIAFYLKYPPDKFQQEIGTDISQDYYSKVNFSDKYRFANVETRNINWETDVYQEQILIGDELAVSDGQAKEHFLTKVFEITDPVGFIVFRGYQTNPKLKCLYSRNSSPVRRDENFEYIISDESHKLE